MLGEYSPIGVLTRVLYCIQGTALLVERANTMYHVAYTFSETDSGILTVKESELRAVIYDIISKGGSVESITKID